MPSQVPSGFFSFRCVSRVSSPDRAALRSTRVGLCLMVSMTIQYGSNWDHNHSYLGLFKSFIVYRMERRKRQSFQNSCIYSKSFWVLTRVLEGAENRIPLAMCCSPFLGKEIMHDSTATGGTICIHVCLSKILQAYFKPTREQATSSRSRHGFVYHPPQPSPVQDNLGVSPMR